MFLRGRRNLRRECCSSGEGRNCLNREQQDAGRLCMCIYPLHQLLSIIGIDFFCIYTLCVLGDRVWDGVLLFLVVRVEGWAVSLRGNDSLNLCQYLHSFFHLVVLRETSFTLLLIK